MSHLIAVASSDGKVVNQHFGHSRQFLIFEINDENSWEFKELRNTQPACSESQHSESSMQEAVEALSDCSAVIVSQIGYGAVQALNSRGIRAFVVRDIIDDALNEVISLIKQ